MKIFDEMTDFKFNHSAVTLGKFDGLHIGHQRLVNVLLSESKRNQYETILFSFDTSKISGQQSITTKAERSVLCEKYGLDNVIFYPVNHDTMSMAAEEFIENILIKKLDAKLIVTGEDFRFGKGRRGDVALLGKLADQYGYRLIVEKSVSVDGVKASSTNIKEYIKSGEIKRADEMLGYSYFIMGEVIRGNQIGRTIDAKTVNLIPDKNKLIPPNGVYKTKISVNKKIYKSITNIGLCPTVRNDNMITIETHIFDFNEEIYHQGVIIEFERFIREERKFSNIDELKNQILLDISEANL